METNWTIEPGVFGPRMVMTGAWSLAALDAMASGGIRELELNYAKGWKCRSLSFLTDLSQLLEALVIIDRSIDNVDNVNDLENIRYLKIHTYCSTEIRFAQFPHLEECVLEWRPKALSLFQHRGVKRLFVNKWSHGRDLADFSGMLQLEALRLYSPTRLESLAGIECLTELARFELALAKRLTSLSGIEALKNLLCLHIGTCTKIRDISPVATLNRLRELFLNNCGEIESVRPLRSLQDLEKIIFYESTNVLDGDLTPLKGLPKLKEVAFQNRRHYSHTAEDF